MNGSDDPANGHNRKLAPRAIDDDEVDDIIGIASEIAEEDRAREAQLDVDDVVQIGEELGLDDHHVERAVDELRDRQQRDVETSARRKKVLLIGAGVVGAVLVLLLLLGLSGRSSLRDLQAEVDEKRAQLQNVKERQREVNARYTGQAATPERDAELAGATNRVAIERRRYNKVVSRYNKEAGSLSGSLGVMFFGMPEKLPLSTELSQK